MAILRSTSPGQLGKYVVPLVEMLNESMNSGTALKGGTKTFVLKKTRENTAALKKFQQLANGGAKTQKQALDVILEVKDTKQGTVTVGQLDKPKGNLNFGDMSEGVVACAIAARFSHKNRDITNADVFAVIRGLAKKPPSNYPGKSGKYVERMYDSPNKNPNVSDTVRLYISLADVNMSALLDRKNESVLGGYVSSAVVYANSANVSKWSKTLYENNRVDHIEVISDGLGGQRTTKVDLRVKVTDHRGNIVPVDINLSMKAGDVKQFGQVSGAEFEKQEELWERMFGYGSAIKTLKSKYETLMFKKKKPEDAVALVYESVRNLLNRDLGGNKSQATLKRLGDAITHFATLDEEGVSILQVGAGTATVYIFENVYEKLAKNKFAARIDVGKSDLPSLVIHAGEHDLLRVRVKQEFKSDGSPYIRNYIEKEKLFTKLFAVYL